jgi:hypothetical protein
VFAVPAMHEQVHQQTSERRKPKNCDSEMSTMLGPKKNAGHSEQDNNKNAGRLRQKYTARPAAIIAIVWHDFFRKRPVESILDTLRTPRCFDIDQYLVAFTTVELIAAVIRTGAMNTQTAGNGSLNIIALGWALSAALVVLFVICLVVALVIPDWPAAHGWISLFSVAPMKSVRVWIDGIVFSIVFGWVSAVVFGLVYNYCIRR